MTGHVDEGLTRVAGLVAAAESAIRALDTDPADGWGLLATERLEVVELMEQLTSHPVPIASGGSVAPDGVDTADPAALYEAAAAVAAGINPSETPTGLLAALVQALTNAALMARAVRRGPSSV